VVCENATPKYFFPHLIKGTFCVPKKIKRSVKVPPFLDSRWFKLQAFFFKFNMSNNVKGVMWETKDVNPFIQKKLTIRSNHFGPQVF
jgi:hypothetical protein